MDTSKNQKNMKMMVVGFSHNEIEKLLVPDEAEQVYKVFGFFFQWYL